mmetsp:Transcript_24068/g.46033  ORF Transcript_24068/g.46033 Transcript_24068/m.46033 type:complete len:128 (+) Transcript_24068:115-498(+)
MRRNLHFMVRMTEFWLVDDGPDNRDAVTTENNDFNNSTSSMLAQQKYVDETKLYQWGTKTAVRRFCRTCGVLPFYIPRSNPDGYAITLPCVDWGEDGQPKTEIRSFDGVNWEQSRAATGIAKETENE